MQHINKVFVYVSTCKRHTELSPESFLHFLFMHDKSVQEFPYTHTQSVKNDKILGMCITREG